LWFTKTNAGFPWDNKPYDDKFIYDRLTENGWSSPRDYKMQDTPMAICPRYWDGDPTVTQFHDITKTGYGIYQDCKRIGSSDNKNVLYTIEGPFNMDFGGDVGVQPTILIPYYWGDMQHREQLFLTQEFGWVKWTHATPIWVSGQGIVWQIADMSIHNKIVLGIVKPVFPCTPIL
jgi:hypothetical protein